ncbi:alpha/beta fold hydrolase [Persephonella sp.]
MKKFFVHGWSFSSQIWKDFKGLKNSTFLDLPFHGLNREYTGENIMDSFASELYSRIENASEKVVLIGWSLGASISILTGLKRPKNLERLVLIGFSPKFKDKKLGHNPAMIKAFMLALKMDFPDTVYNFRKTAAGDYFREIPLPEKEGATRILREFINLDLTDRLHMIDIPVLLIHGREDRIINPEGSIFAKDSIKNSELILVDSHHAPFLDYPEVLKDSLL